MVAACWRRPRFRSLWITVKEGKVIHRVWVTLRAAFPRWGRHSWAKRVRRADASVRVVGRVGYCEGHPPTGFACLTCGAQATRMTGDAHGEPLIARAAYLLHADHVRGGVG